VGPKKEIGKEAVEFSSEVSAGCEWEDREGGTEAEFLSRRRLRHSKKKGGIAQGEPLITAEGELVYNQTRLRNISGGALGRESKSHRATSANRKNQRVGGSGRTEGKSFAR